ncbi:MAG TPA: hypothetical protein PLJ12_01425 [Planctomycetota bacterium]|nr:hypothetical protein [Planctomycetota bacterium]
MRRDSVGLPVPGPLPVASLARGDVSWAQDMARFQIPSGYSRIHIVTSFEELVATPLVAGTNALCWPRELPGDFGEVVKALGPGAGIEDLDDARIAKLKLSAAGRRAAELLLEDQRRLRDLHLDPVLNAIHEYRRDEGPGPVSTDVFSFHLASAPVETDTWLCSYFGAPTEGLRNDQARRHVDLPKTRAALLERFGGEDAGEFSEYLREHHFDLHYAAEPNAEPFSFGLGNLWRVAVQWPGCPVPAFIHRAPAMVPGQPPRLLLIS